MNFQQLRIMREAARSNCNLTEVANRLYTSQSGVSKHIKDLEAELGVELFHRRGKRLLGLTEPGRELVKIAERMLLDVRNIKNLADNFNNTAKGDLTIATTHTQVRYALPRVILEFRRLYPGVHLKIHQGSPGEIVEMLRNGEADIGIATESLKAANELASFAFHRWRHCVIVPQQHPLSALPTISLRDIAAYPIVTYHEGYTGRSVLDEVFRNGAITPDIVLSALDADVIKSYVELGLGVGLVASIAFDPVRDGGLVRIEMPNLFPEIITRIAVRRGLNLRAYAYHFVRLCVPTLDEELVRTAQSPNYLLRDAMGEPLEALSFDTDDTE